MVDEKSASTTSAYVDHPAPSAWMFFLLMLGVFGCLAGLCLFVVALLEGEAEVPGAAAISLIVVFALSAGVCLFYLWPMYATYYAIGPSGLAVKYGPWKRTYSWDEFESAYPQRGMFTGRIGWPTITPCVRITDAAVFKRKKGWFPLYLTPNDSRAFLKKVEEFAPELTRRAIL